jgi:hypothetical protein
MLLDLVLIGFITIVVSAAAITIMDIMAMRRRMRQERKK